MSEPDETMNLRHILTKYRDHDGLGWPAMFAYLRTFDHRRIAELTASIAKDGIKEPISLGNGQVLDGMHRLAVLESLDWRDVPVIYTEDGSLA